MTPEENDRRRGKKRQRPPVPEEQERSIRIRDRHGYWRTVTARLVIEKRTWRYEATVTPSKSGRIYHGDPFEPVDALLTRVTLRLQRWLSGW